MTNADFIAKHIYNSISSSVNYRYKQLGRPVILVDSENDKEKIIDTIKRFFQEYPNQVININRIDLSNVSSINELVFMVFQRIYDSQGEKVKLSYDLSQWIEKLKSGTEDLVIYNYGLFIFDNLEKANEDVLNGVKDMYHSGRDCIIPIGWEFVSFCHHNAKIWDARFAISTIVFDYNEK